MVAVVVTYQPGAGMLDNLRHLSRQIQEIIVVDNASWGAPARLVEAAGMMPGVCLIRNPENLGIAAALNIGVRHALDSGRNWIATFDQDTIVPENFFAQLWQVYENCPTASDTSMLVPGGWREPGAEVPSKSSTVPKGVFVSGAVTSGSLIKAAVFPQTGFFDESLFIDYVDTDFCLRLRQRGFKILSAPLVLLEHELGEKQIRNLLGFKFSFRIHTAWRYYYIMRNRLILYRRFLAFDPGWAFHDACWLILELGRIFLLEHGRTKKLRAVFHGFKDGLMGRAGQHPEFPPPRK